MEPAQRPLELVRPCKHFVSEINMDRLAEFEATFKGLPYVEWTQNHAEVISDPMLSHLARANDGDDIVLP